jgi:hypothetical protein
MDPMSPRARQGLRRTLIAAGIAILLMTALIWMRSADRVLPPTARIETPHGTVLMEIAATPAARAAGL